MSATYTNLLRLAKQVTGTNPDTWGQILNRQIELVEDSVAGVATITLAAANVALSESDGAQDEARCFALVLQGAPASNLNVSVPDSTKFYLVINKCTGTNKVNVKTTLGNGVVVPNGEGRMLWCDGTDVMYAAKAHDTALVDGQNPGTVVPYDVWDGADTPADDELLTTVQMDGRYQSQADTVAGFTTGDAKFSINAQQSGWVVADDGTIGPTNSGATTLADDSTEALYALIWDNIDPQYINVIGGRGNSASSDWQALKPIELPETVGRMLIAAGNGAGLTRRQIGQTGGNETHKITIAEMPPHHHDYHRYGSGGTGAGASNDDSGADVQTGNTGGGEAMDLMNPYAVFPVLIKL